MTTDASDLLFHVSTRTWVGLVTVVVVAAAAAAGAGGAVYLGYPDGPWWTHRSGGRSVEGGTASKSRPKPKSKSKSKSKSKANPTARHESQHEARGVVVGTATATATATTTGGATMAAAVKKKRRKTKGQRFREGEGEGEAGDVGIETQERGVSVPGAFDAAGVAGEARVVGTATEHEGESQNQNQSKDKNKNKTKTKTKAKTKQRKRVHESWTDDEGENEGEGEGEGEVDKAAMTDDPAVPRKPAKTPVDTDSSWTHIDRGKLTSRVPPRTAGAAAGHVADKAEVPSSEGDDATSSDHDSEASLDRILMALRDGVRLPVSRRHMARRARRMGMLRQAQEEEDGPRVIRVQPPPDETPVPGFTWDDYGDVVEDGVHAHDADAEDEGEWGVVKGRHRTRQTTMATSSTSGVVTSEAAPASATEHKTKKQRQNARKREMAKAAKASVEADRLQGLAEHKRELERRRIVEQSQQGGGKRPSGGMQAKVDELGKLVWE